MLAGCGTKCLELLHLSRVNQQYWFTVLAFFHFISSGDPRTEENLVGKDKRLHLVGKNVLLKFF